MNILIVRLRLIGDVVFTTPVIRALRSRYPDARITYLVERRAVPVVARNPHLTAVIAVEHSRGWTRIRDDIAMARRLHSERFELVIDLHGGPRSAWFTWATRARVRVGYDVPGRSWMYTRTVARPKAFRARHAVENQWELLAAVDPAFDRPVSRSADPVEMTVDPDERRRIDHRLASLGIPSHHRVTVIHVSAGNPFRRWPESSFADVAAGISELADDSWVLVTAGPSDRDATTRVIAAARTRARDGGARILDDEGLSLGELRALMDRASLFVGGDSGPMHVAATSTVPVVGLYGPTLPVRSAPWRPESVPGESVEGGPLPCRPCDQRICVPGDFRCLSRISPGDIIDACRRLLGAGPATPLGPDR